MIKVINNFLDNTSLFFIVKNIKKNDFAWYWNNNQKFLGHVFYKQYKIVSNKIFILQTLEDKLKYKQVYESYVNYIPPSKNVTELEFNIDADLEGTTAIIDLNTNDGYTKIMGGPKIEAVENRCILMDSKLVRSYATSTNSEGRYFLNCTFTK